MTITGGPPALRMRSRTVRPSTPGSQRSRITRSNSSRANAAIPSSPESQAVGRWPSSWRMFESVVRMDCSSSMMRIVAIQLSVLGCRLSVRRKPTTDNRQPTTSSRWKFDLKPGPFRMIVVNGDLPVVVADDAMDDREPQSRPPPFRRKVRQEELLLVGIGNAPAGIGDLDDHAVRRAARGDADLAALGGLHRVLEQIADSAADLLRIHEQFDVGIDGHPHRDTVLDVAIEARGLLQDVGELGVTHVHGGHPRKSRELIDHP